ncbi:WD40-like Beta Propeller Repeat [Flavobacterium resistens]|uniref:OmpA family protein n=1 Tax=Flavobacterium resistens TaxID=443612 RepID=A0A521EZ97_9FLAO|nr:OmpA family protein [Flavobacterium resistens]MRX69320.1 OmpA family protein [Flavobacterium resistens]SMO89225.1 WD40-like Beta Propeller Repeat [Flavobacterium resistens]
MKKKNIYVLGAFLICLTSFSQGKNSKLGKADKLYEERAYFKSIEVYEKVADKGFKSVELFEKLGDSYFFNAEYAKANKWYEELFKLSTDVAPIYYYRYSQTLKSVGDNNKATEYLKKFSELNASDNRSLQYANNSNYLADITDNSKSYVVENASINSSFSDYGASIYNDKLIFTSSRTPEDVKSKKDNWTADYYSSLYSASLSKDNKVSNAEFFAKEIQTKLHESDPVFSKDGKTMFFTKSYETKKTKLKKAVVLKIYKATLVDNKWSNVQELPFNNDLFSCAHPSLSPDEKTLYFASDMPGGYGETDLYKTTIDITNNTVGLPINLGSNINTQGKETFPWIGYDNKLYFASDGHLGLGGLDIFVAENGQENYNQKVINIGQPINSKYDDFGFIKLQSSNAGFFTSNREGGMGKDDIYLFKEQAGKLNINGQVIDIMTSMPIAAAQVVIFDKNHNVIGTTNTDNLGGFLATIDPKKDGVFYVKVESPDYEIKEVEVITKEIDPKKGIVLTVTKIKTPLNPGTDLAKVLNIKEIYFDLDKANIRPDAEVELQKIVQVLKEFPNIKIAVRSHTDSRQTNNYNMNLSEKRAKSTRAYIVAKGISGSRITAKGYGETMLLNKCSDGVECSEAEHQLNRRSEFIIVK